MTNQQPKMITSRGRRELSRTQNIAAHGRALMDFRVERPWWPQFFATSLFLPRIKVLLTNDDVAFDTATLTLRMAAFEGDTLEEGGFMGHEGFEVARREFTERWGAEKPER